jgi:hypothetical protein
MSRIFSVTSNKMVCSDPCYSIPTWCQGVIENVRNGKWEAGIATSDEGSWGERVSHLWVYNIDAVIKNPSIKEDIERFMGGSTLPYTFGVDSGQFGFFDFDNYRKDSSVEGLPKYDFGGQFPRGDEEGEAWYETCCHLTLGEESWGVIPNGVVSSSGYGDGSYEVRGIKDNGEYVAFCVEYIGQEEDDEDDDWGDDDDTQNDD